MVVIPWSYMGKVFISTPSPPLLTRIKEARLIPEVHPAPMGYTALAGPEPEGRMAMVPIPPPAEDGTVRETACPGRLRESP